MRIPRKLSYVLFETTFRSFSMDVLDTENAFEVNLSFTLKLEGVVSNFVVLNKANFPMPFCNDNTTLTLPGDGSVGGFVTALGGEFVQSAVDLVLEYLGLKVRKELKC